MSEIKSLEMDDMKVSLRVPIGMHSRLAQHLTVQDVGELVQLSFFEVMFPLVGPDLSDSDIAAIKSTGVTADCVARISVPKSRFPDFAKAIASIAERFKDG